MALPLIAGAKAETLAIRTAISKGRIMVEGLMKRC